MAVFYPEAPTKVAKRTLTFAERVAYQHAIEDVYWRNRIWPKEHPDRKPPLDAVMSQAQLANKVTDYLRKSRVLEDFWHRPLTAEQLQAEMDRMAKRTKQPNVLRELFGALGNDPFVIAECLARPALAERLMTDWYAYDQRIHGDLKQRAEADLLMHPTIEKMKQSGGTYSEVEWIRTDNDPKQVSRDFEHRLKLTNGEWDEAVRKLSATFGSLNSLKPSVFRAGRSVTASKVSDTSAPCTADAYDTIPVEKLSSLEEDDAAYFAVAVLSKTKERLKLGTVSWPKEPVQSWMSRTQREISNSVELTNNTYTIPTISDDVSACTDNTWAASSLNMPIGRESHTAVWTGSEMIIWGGAIGYPSTGLNTGGRFNPSTGTWTTVTTVNAPSARGGHTAVWTGSEMIVWGGGWTNTGGRYNPGSDSWTATTRTNAPTGRSGHTAVWTGTHMIVWGGYNGQFGEFNTGGRYNPVTNSWTATATTNAPAARDFHTAVWTGSEMIIWGGEADNFLNFFNTGGRYNPVTNSWTATSTANAPSARAIQTAVWTGSGMIVWGGTNNNVFNLNTGGRYNPATNSWTGTTLTNVPAGRYDHTAVWTDHQMIIWGGQTAPGYVNSGSRYNPGTNSWTAISGTNAPLKRVRHSAIWTGSEMIVWGGSGDRDYLNLISPGRYNPATNTWTSHDPPTARIYETAVWTGTEMIVWGGFDLYTFNLNTGGKYNPTTESWVRVSSINAPVARSYHTAIWTGDEMIVWGGYGDYSNLNTGGRYNPSTDSWLGMTTVNAPAGRSFHSAVWTGTQMIVWGGSDGSISLRTGGRYTPTNDSWMSTGINDAPAARSNHTAVWTGNEMIIWGGSGDTPVPHNGLNTGGRYNPTTNHWTVTTTTNAPSARFYHTAVWTGSEMVVWGGSFDDGTLHYLNTGARYDPGANTWTTITDVNAPYPRGLHTTVWTGEEMIVWGGLSDIFLPIRGARYRANVNVWVPISQSGNAPDGEYSHTAVWTGSEMIVWGGIGRFDYSNTGGRYCAVCKTVPTQAAIADFNGDGSPDYVLSNINDRRTAIWYLNNNVYIGSVYGPTPPGSWHLRGVADFNLDTHPDYALFVPNNNQTVITYLSGPTVIGAAYGPTLPHDWELVATADLNGDTYPDYVLYNPSTGQTQVFYLNNNVYVGADFGPTLPLHWTLVGVADFNSDGYADYLLFNMDTGQTVIVYLSGLTVVGAAYGPTLPSAWAVVASADFNGDGSPDYLVYKADIRQTAILYLQNNVYVGAALGPPIPAGWSLLMQ